MKKRRCRVYSILRKQVCPLTSEKITGNDENSAIENIRIGDIVDYTARERFARQLMTVDIPAHITGSAGYYRTFSF